MTHSTTVFTMIKTLSFFLKFSCLSLLFLFMNSCGSNSLEDFREEGQGIIRSLIAELQTIHNRNQLIASSHRLETHFNRLADVMIAAEEFHLKHPKTEKLETTSFDSELSDQLRSELNRIYRIEGGKQILEKTQEKALRKLENFKKSITKKTH